MGLALIASLSSGPGALTEVHASPQPDLRAVQAQVTALEMRAAGANEEYKQALAQLGRTREQQASLRNRLVRERSMLAIYEQSTNALARAAYMSGGLPPSIHLLMADDPRELLSQADRLDAVARSQITSIRRSQAARAVVEQHEAALADQGRVADRILDQMRAAKQAINTRLAQARSLLAALQPVQREQLASQAADRARQARAEARRVSQALASTTRRPVSSSSRATAAVQYALSHVGSPYSLNAHPPTSWDCSKLTAAAWSRGGVGLTALSYAQWNQVQRIPSSQLRPGDLVFYFRGDAHHVALYVGNGKMVSASNPSDGVEVIDYLGPWYAEHYSGAGRVL
ncbi:MAG: NlpC/P60 family protein [Actinomycetota bacterium]|nr:NlpC/P60 family protein [Actinomycetota bacterium]